MRKKILAIVLVAILATMSIAFIACETKTHTVTFDLNGGSATFALTATVDDGQAVGEPATDPTKDGYTFKHWSLSGGTAEYAFSTSVTSDITLIAQWKEDEIETVAVTGVSLNKATTAILAGGNEQLTATVAPATATNQNVSWSSNAESVATVAQNGTVSGVSAGTAVITATTADGSFKATCTVTVAPVVQPTGVSWVMLDKLDMSVAIGKTGALAATVLPANATNKGITWTSSHSNIATVSTNGVVTGVALGVATITARTVDGSFTATCPVTVGAVATGVNLNVTSKSIQNREEAALVATVAPENAANTNVTWKSSDETKAIVNSKGLVTGVAEGSVTITATAEGGITATCAITVVAIRVDSVSTLSSASINVGSIANLRGKVVPVYAANQNITYVSSDNTKVTVSADGIVTGVAKGAATITATSQDGNKTATSYVVVNWSPVKTYQFEAEDTEFIMVAGGGNNGPKLDPFAAASNTMAIGWFTGAIGRTLRWNITSDIDTKAEFRVGVSSPDANNPRILTSTHTGLKVNGSFVNYDNAELVVSGRDGVQGLKWRKEFIGIIDLKAGNNVISYETMSTARQTPNIDDMSLSVESDAKLNWTAGYGPGSQQKVGGTGVLVTGITLDKSTASVAVDATTLLTPTVAPAGSIPRVIWTSSNESIATVTINYTEGNMPVADPVVSGAASHLCAKKGINTCTVRGIAAGTVTITATTLEGEFIATCIVTVTS